MGIHYLTSPPPPRAREAKVAKAKVKAVPLGTVVKWMKDLAQVPLLSLAFLQLSLCCLSLYLSSTLSHTHSRV